MAMTPITVGIINATGGTTFVRAGQNTDGSISFFNNLELAGALVSMSNGLPTIQAGSVGSDSSSNSAALAGGDIGATVGTSLFGGTGSFAGYVLVGSVPSNPTRAGLYIENISGQQVVCVRDDGTAAAGAAPANASWFLLGGGTGVPSQGGSWASTTFKGRIQIWALTDPGVTARPTIMQD